MQALTRSVSQEFCFNTSFRPRKLLENSSEPLLIQPLPPFRANACSVAFFSVLGRMLLQMSAHMRAFASHADLWRKDCIHTAQASLFSIISPV